MGITVVEHNGINVKIVKQYLYGSTKKKEKVAKHKDIVERHKKTIQLMELKPFHPSLRFHALKGKLSELHSVSIDMQYRISIEFYVKDKRIIPVNIGTHDDVY
jgi:mRNA-degrading endonuclease YafQ of YafQ-DinJ toxin-antitoxin module